MVLGSPGGSTIITTVAQIISNVIDYKMSLKDAVEAPRTHHQWFPDKIFLEIRFFQKPKEKYGVSRKNTSKT